MEQRRIPIPAETREAARGYLTEAKFSLRYRDIVISNTHGARLGYGAYGHVVRGWAKGGQVAVKVITIEVLRSHSLTMSLAYSVWVSPARTWMLSIWRVR